MDERLDIMATKFTSMDRKLDLGANFDEPQAFPSPDQSSEATYSPPHHA